jgi:hypothetical protein
VVEAGARILVIEITESLLFEFVLKEFNILTLKHWFASTEVCDTGQAPVLPLVPVPPPTPQRGLVRGRISVLSAGTTNGCQTNVLWLPSL